MRVTADLESDADISLRSPLMLLCLLLEKSKFMLHQ